MADPKVVLITGSSSGFGRLMAEALLDRGHTVVATMRDPETRNREAAEALRAHAAGSPGEVHPLELDVTDDASVGAAVAVTLEDVGRIDAVVNNAGYGTGGFGEAFTPEQWRRLFEVNVFGVQRVNRAVLPHMRERGEGLLIHVSSVMGRIVLPFAAPYTASKFALEGMAESYAYELAPSGVDVSIVEPGGFPTNFMEAMTPPEDEERLAGYGERQGEPQELWSGMAEILSSGDAPDPALVARAVVELVETPAGRRPLRRVVAPVPGEEGPNAINGTSREVQRQVLSGFDMPQYLGPLDA